jgi:hypothetical protein
MVDGMIIIMMTITIGITTRIAERVLVTNARQNGGHFYRASRDGTLSFARILPTHRG